MKIRFLATGQSPDYYTIAGEVISAHHGGQSEVYDLSGFPEGGVFQGADPVNGAPAIRNVERTNGELKVTLCQQVGAGHWQESGWMETADYDPDAINVKQDTSKAWAGQAQVKTRQGWVVGDDVIRSEVS